MLEPLRQEIETLPIEIQERLLEIVHTLKQEQETESNKTIINNYENFEKMGLIGCCSTDQNLSVNYKQALTEEWSKKYGIQNKSQPRQKGSAKGKLTIHSEDNEHLEAFQDYMPQ